MTRDACRSDSPGSRPKGQSRHRCGCSGCSLRLRRSEMTTDSPSRHLQTGSEPARCHRAAALGQCSQVSRDLARRSVVDRCQMVGMSRDVPKATAWATARRVGSPLCLLGAGILQRRSQPALGVCHPESSELGQAHLRAPSRASDEPWDNRSTYESARRPALTPSTCRASFTALSTVVVSGLSHIT